MNPELLGYLAGVSSIIGVVIAIFSTNWKLKMKIAFSIGYVFFTLANVAVWKLLERPTPRITLNMEVLSSANSAVDPRAAPFSVFVRGKVENANLSYTYLIVNDHVHEYVQPTSGFGYGVNSDFSGYCYLGKENDPNSENKNYSISAVIVNREYNEYDHLDRGSIIAESNKLLLYRHSVP